MNYSNLILALAVSFVTFIVRSQDRKVPNIVVIFIDDMGYGDITPFGSTTNYTPNLVKMAKEGMKLTSFYVASPVCTPSRASLMTGCYPQRVGLNWGSDHIVLFPGDPHGLNPKEITIAELLKTKNYVTGCFGKWHLGDQPGFLPLDQGFDEFYGIPYSSDMWIGNKNWKFPDLPVMRGNTIEYLVEDMAGQAKLCSRFTEEAISFIKRNKEKPFFCYIPQAFVHAPRMASPEFMANAKTAEEGQIEEIDWNVGQILETLKDLKLDKSTLVLFTSDNGPAGGLSAGPLRGRKASVYEGGHRVPTIAWWPGRIPSESECDELTGTIDLLPTFAGLAKIDLPNDRVIDGKDIWPLLAGRVGAKTPHDRFFYQQKGNLSAVRSGDWKLLTNGELYNLKEDLAESLDVADENPEVVKKLQRMLRDFDIEISSNKREVGIVEGSRTLVPRPGVVGEDAYLPTLVLMKRDKGQ
ncbi:sulfatase family protein [Zobellia galactanivorans]|uniref:Sulfatase, family S1-14 n=1 Tax=Zobellia galactanivorans (strain DSM 12802 / CCUG 47099 / CIP 106680 / NCIMB 13871 / Dsij) TaxID=63186 RepID=G0LCC6_ZOBGA|nr:sulfatase [Zobellia galactanivorans]CAZ96829.1 Sulfatase, family S1-14 [Zobellia galactanivorans]